MVPSNRDGARPERLWASSAEPPKANSELPNNPDDRAPTKSSTPCSAAGATTERPRVGTEEIGQEPTMAAGAAPVKTRVMDTPDTSGAAWSNAEDLEPYSHHYAEPAWKNWFIAGTALTVSTAAVGVGAYLYYKHGRHENTSQTTIVATSTNTSPVPTSALVSTPSVPATTALAPSASMLSPIDEEYSSIDEEYLADIYSQGLPVSEVNRDSLIQIGHETCTTAKQYPSMQVVDLALALSDERTAYPYDKAHIIVTAALDHYCPTARPAAGPVVAKTAR